MIERDSSRMTKSSATSHLLQHRLTQCGLVITVQGNACQRMSNLHEQQAFAVAQIASGLVLSTRAGTTTSGGFDVAPTALRVDE